MIDLSLPPNIRELKCQMASSEFKTWIKTQIKRNKRIKKPNSQKPNKKLNKPDLPICQNPMFHHKEDSMPTTIRESIDPPYQQPVYPSGTLLQDLNCNTQSSVPPLVVRRNICQSLPINTHLRNLNLQWQCQCRQKRCRAVKISWSSSSSVVFLDYDGSKELRVR